MSGFLLMIMNNHVFKYDLFSFIVFVTFAMSMSAVGMINKEYKEKSNSE